MSDQENFKVPEWLTSGFIQQVLEKKYQSEDVTLTSFHVEVGSKKGQGFVSEMFRLRVNTSIGDFSLILKKPHELKDRYEMLQPYNMFHKEITFYGDFFPAIRASLESVDEFEPMVPEVFYGDKETEVMIMEDLKVKGYLAADVKNRVSLEQARVVLRKLAKIHAASMVVNQEKSGQFAKRIWNLFLIDGGAFNDLMNNHVNALSEELLCWGEEFASIADKWPRFAENFVRLAGQRILSENRLNVLIHGDLWFTNMMFRRLRPVGSEAEAEEEEKSLFIDFQTSSWGSLALDLVHFFYTSLNEEEYQEKRDELIGEYHGHLVRILKKLKWEAIPTLEEILQEFDDKIIFGELERKLIEFDWVF